MSQDDFDVKEEFFATVMDAIIAAGYPDPGFYVGELHGEPVIFSSDGEPLQSIADDSPIDILRDFVGMLDRLGY